MANNLGNSQNANVESISQVSQPDHAHGLESKKLNLVDNRSKIYNDVELTVLFSPAQYLRDLGLADSIPNFMQLLYITQTDYHLYARAHSAQLDWQGATVNLALLVHQNGPLLKRFFRPRSPAAQQLILQFNTVANQTEPARAYRNALPRTVMDMSAIFARFTDLNIERSSYFLTPYFLLLNWQNGLAGLPPVGWSHIGLGALAQLGAQAGIPELLDGYYPVLWPGVDVNDATAIQGLAIWCVNVVGRELLLVYTDATSYNAALVHNAAPGAITDMALHRIVKIYDQFLTKEDQDMLWCISWGYYHAWDGRDASNTTYLGPNDVTRFIYHYDFFDHLAWFLTEGKFQDMTATEGPPPNMVLGGIRAIFQTIWNITIRRTYDFYAYDWTSPGLTPQIWSNCDPLTRPTNSGTTFIGHRAYLYQYIPPCFFTFFTRRPLLAGFYDLSKVERTITTGGAEVLIVNHEVKDGQPLFIPAYIINNTQDWDQPPNAHRRKTDWITQAPEWFPPILFAADVVGGSVVKPALHPVTKLVKGILKRPKYEVWNGLNYGYTYSPGDGEVSTFYNQIGDPDTAGWSFLG